MVLKLVVPEETVRPDRQDENDDGTEKEPGQTEHGRQLDAQDLRPILWPGAQKIFLGR